MMEDHYFVTAPWVYFDATLVNTFRQAMPDQCEHLVRLGEHLGSRTKHVTIFQVMEWLGYDGPVEDLSMWLCIFFDKNVNHHDVIRELREVDGQRRAIKIAPPTQLGLNTCAVACVCGVAVGFNCV